MVRKRRVVLGHREILERQTMLGSVDMQRPVEAAVPFGVAERPVAADAVGRLKRRITNAVVLEHLARGQTANARTDHRDMRVCMIHRHSSRRNAIYECF